MTDADADDAERHLAEAARLDAEIVRIDRETRDRLDQLREARDAAIYKANVAGVQPKHIVARMTGLRSDSVKGILTRARKDARRRGKAADSE